MGICWTVSIPSSWLGGRKQANYFIRLSVVALPLVFAPKLVLFLADTERSAPTPLESFLSWNIGIILCAVAVALVMNVCSRLQYSSSCNLKESTGTIQSGRPHCEAGCTRPPSARAALCGMSPHLVYLIQYHLCRLARHVAMPWNRNYRRMGFLGCK